MTTVNPILIALISLYPNWTDEQRQYGKLFPREIDHKHLVQYTDADYGYKIQQWAWHLLRYKHTLVGFRILIGLYTGSHARHIEKIKQYIVNHPSAGMSNT